jgi:hypothetical protein
MAPSPCPECGAALVRARRRWHERWRVRVVKRCTRCGVRLVYPHVHGSRPNAARLGRIALLGLVFLLVAVAGPALVIYVLPAPDTAMGGGAVIDE